MPLIYALLFALEEAVAGGAVDVSFSSVYPVAVFGVLVLVKVYIVGLLLLLLNVDFFGLQEVGLGDGCVLYFSLSRGHW